MAIPTFDKTMLPILQLASDQEEHSVQETVQYMERHFNLTDEECADMLPSGRQRVIVNRVGWARTFLKKAECIEYTKRGHFRILQRGLDILAKKPEAITVKDLEEFPEFKNNWESKKDDDTEKNTTETDSEITPESRIDIAYEQLFEQLKNEIIEHIMTCSPYFFERLVVDVLIQMGYGGSRKDAGKAIGKTGDGGIDGIINEDKLGLDTIFIQAKRWEGTVGRPEIQKFSGALAGHRAKKGVFITTSSYSNEAREYAKNLDSKIILIDGSRLAELMIEYGVGVTPVIHYDIKQIDIDYFAEE